MTRAEYAAEGLEILVLLGKEAFLEFIRNVKPTEPPEPFLSGFYMRHWRDVSIHDL